MLIFFADCVLAAVLAIFVIFAIKTYKRPEIQDKKLGTVILAGSFVLLFYFLNCNASTPTAMSVFASLEHIAGIWSLFFLGEFTYAFIKKPVNKNVSFPIFVVICIDSALLLSNNINGYMAKVLINQGRIFSTAVFMPKYLYIIHSLSALIIIVILVVRLVGSFFAENSYYKTRYAYYLVAYMFIVVPCLVFLFSGGRMLSMSRWGYVIGVAIIYFDTYVYMPSRIENQLMKIVEDNVYDASVVFSANGKLAYANNNSKEMFKEASLSNLDTFMEFLNNPSEGKSKVSLNNKWYDLLFKNVHDDKNALAASMFIFHDVTENEEQLKREHEVSTFDPVTKAYNRVGFFENAKAFLEQHKDEGNYAVMVSDIIRFKGLNSLYGTKVGDQVLIEIATKLHRAHHDFPMLYGRTAEGKFASILPFENVDEMAAELNCANVAIGEGLAAHVDMCHGFVVMDDDLKALDYYYELAIIALDKCKQKAGASVLEYSDDMEEDQHRKQMLLSEMHNAIAERQFYIELQPQIDLRTNKVEGAEALVRWMHPNLGKIAPYEFIPLFENNGFISNLDKYVWEEAAITLSKLSKLGIYDGPVSVNVSQVDIMNMDVSETLFEILNKHHVPIDKLHVEITESAYAENAELLIRTMKSLRDKGFIVEVDDFGSGYSSLYSLIRLPFDIVKLDMMFMRENSTDKSKIVIESIVNMIHSLDAKIIVEGVEYENNALTAAMLGCDIAQGYYYSKPISIDEFEEYVKKYS